MVLCLCLDFSLHFIAVGGIAPYIWYVFMPVRSLVFQIETFCMTAPEICCYHVMTDHVMTDHVMTDHVMTDQLYADPNYSVLFLFIIVAAFLFWNAWHCDMHVAIWLQHFSGSTSLAALLWQHFSGSICRFDVNGNRPVSPRCNGCAWLHVEALPCRQCILLNTLPWCMAARCSDRPATGLTKASWTLG